MQVWITITYALESTIVSSMTHFLFLVICARSLPAGVGMSVNCGIEAPALAKDFNFQPTFIRAKKKRKSLVV